MSAATLHVTSGDVAGALLADSGIGGEVLVWRDLLYDGPRNPGWPSPATREARARFIAETTAGGLSPDLVRRALDEQYARLKSEGRARAIVLWFDGCLFDQSMLAHLLTFLAHLGIARAELLCIAAFPGIARFNGLGLVAASDSAPQFWGDTTLWTKINSLARRQPPLVQIHGPTQDLPQWQGGRSLREYRLSAPPELL